jgi:hypothetical protein
VDTITKRLMSNQGKIVGSQQLNLVIFKDKATAGVGTKFFSLFPGLGYAAGYKVRSILPPGSASWLCPPSTEPRLSLRAL